MQVFVPRYMLANTNREVSACLANVYGIASRTTKFINYTGAHQCRDWVFARKHVSKFLGCEDLLYI